MIVKKIQIFERKSYENDYFEIQYQSYVSMVIFINFMLIEHAFIRNETVPYL